jgi:sigma-B regulation protein RsbU (phosphoserine phosphatase)
MANLQAMLRIFAAGNSSPRDVCARLNYHFHEVTDASKFATFFYAEWNPQKKSLQYVNAGHNPPILLGANGTQRLNAGGMPLGIFPGTEFDMGEVDMRTQDLLVLYSDGLTEASTPGGEEFGDERLERLVSAHREKSLAEIQSRVLEDIRSWSGREPEDDLTLVMVRATGSAEETK